MLPVGLLPDLSAGCKLTAKVAVAFFLKLPPFGHSTLR